jgi:uncharacterized protein (DUF305 family)
MGTHSVSARSLPAAALLILGGAAFVQPAYAQAPAPPGRYAITRADVDFVTGMISHHAQAVVMANWAPDRASSRAVKVLCARIINAQTDEIVIFQQWLADRGQPVPEAKPMPTRMMMGGVEHEMMMPGMLSDAQMTELEQSTGVDFDRNFLAFMIQHHQGAVTMVNELLASPGAAQDEMVFKFASDIYADQTAEIERMQQMLSSLPPR